jgi:hypothetical protein
MENDFDFTVEPFGSVNCISGRTMRHEKVLVDMGLSMLCDGGAVVEKDYILTVTQYLEGLGYRVKRL